MSVWCGGIGCFGVLGVMWCCAVMLPEEGLLLTACLQTVRRKIFCWSSSTTLHSFHFIQYSYPFSLLGKQLATSGSIPGYKLKCPLDGWCAGVSILFVIVHLSPTGRPSGCHSEQFSWEAGSANCQTCITWKVLYRF